MLLERYFFSQIKCCIFVCMALTHVVHYTLSKSSILNDHLFYLYINVPHEGLSNYSLYQFES
jgi:hypothetical protein